MKVKELITALLDCDMDSEVYLCCRDESCAGERAGFYIKEIDDTRIVFEDWRDKSVLKNNTGEWIKAQEGSGVNG